MAPAAELQLPNRDGSIAMFIGMRSAGCLQLLLAFVFLAPRTWFSDRPTLEMTDLRHQQGVVEMSRGKEGWRYLVDARLVESLEPLGAEDAIQEILSSRLQTPFIIKSIVPVKDKNNVTLGYTVLIAH